MASVPTAAKSPGAISINSSSEESSKSSGKRSPLPLEQRDIPDKWDRAHPIIVAKINALARNQLALQQRMESLQRSMSQFAMESRQQIVLNAQVRQWMDKIQGATILGNFVIRPVPSAPDCPLPVPSTLDVPSPEISVPIAIPDDEEEEEEEEEGVEDIQSC